MAHSGDLVMVGERPPPEPRWMSLAVLAPGGRSGCAFDDYANLARIAEFGLFDALVLPAYEAADRGADGPDEPIAFDAVMLMAALSAVTERIGLIAATDPTFDQPYNIARRILSVDHLSGGRAGWAPAIGRSLRQAQTFGLTEPPSRTQRHDRAREFAQVVLGLWDSWNDDAFAMDRSSGRFFDPEKMHFLRHTGEHFMVRGPLNVARSRQGRPVIAELGDGDEGCDLAAQVAEVVCPSGPRELAQAKAWCIDLKARAVALGRGADALRVMPQIAPSGEPAGEIADRLQERFEAGAADGFTLAPADVSELADFVRRVTPELQLRGLFRTRYEGRWLRDHLGLARPQATLGGERAHRIVA